MQIRMKYMKQRKEKWRKAKPKVVFLQRSTKLTDFT